MSLEDYSVMAKAILQDMEAALEEVEENNDKLSKFQEYANYCQELNTEAKKNDLKQISSMCELGSVIGIKAAESGNTGLSTIVAGILFDMCDILNMLFDDMVEGTNKAKEFNIEKFVDRLRWLSGKFKSSPKTEATPESSEEEDGDIDDLDDLLDDFDF